MGVVILELLYSSVPWGMSQLSCFYKMLTGKFRVEMFVVL